MLNLRIGLLLGLRQIQRASLWTTILITIVITFTFLNLVAVSGLLVGIIDGAIKAVREESLGDLIISPLDGEDHILETERFIRELRTYHEISSFSVRYTGVATIEANYKERRDLQGERDIISVNITGIDPEDEDQTANRSRTVSEGSYLSEDDQGYILIGKYYVDRYADQFGNVFESLENIYPGDTVRVTVGDASKEFIVKGIIDSKVDDVSLRVYIPEKEFRRLYERFDHNADQIVARLTDPREEMSFSRKLRETDLGTLAEIESFTEGTPKFITDIKETFDLLGIFIGTIGIIVASISVFIIIFINALSRRRHIGIIKAVGINRRVIEYAYITQAAFYSLAGSLLGIVLTFFFLIPYFDRNPINFPFSDGIISATAEGTLFRLLLLFAVTLIAGFFPAWMIARQNTLNSILGRK